MASGSFCLTLSRNLSTVSCELPSTDERYAIDCWYTRISGFTSEVRSCINDSSACFRCSSFRDPLSDCDKKISLRVAAP